MARGYIDDDEESCLQTVVYVANQETISFYWKVSSEEDGDYLKFYIDDTLKDSISGEVNWQKKSYNVSGAGSHTLKWVYIKDSDIDQGDDCGWVDCVQWTGSPPIKYPDPADWDTITYEYDPAGRRIKKTIDDKYTTKYCYDGGNVIAEYDYNNNLLRKYIYGPRVDEPICMIDAADNDAEYYYHFDGLGSVVALSDSNGDTVQTYEYSIYGQVAAEDPNFLTNPYLFTGRRFDLETGLYYYRARYYNPHIGRFMQTDPVGYDDGMNWYAYCGNNPLAFADPSGMFSKDSNDSNDSNQPSDVDGFHRVYAGSYWWLEPIEDIEAVHLSEAPLSQAASEAVSWALEHEGDKSYRRRGYNDNSSCHAFRRGTWKCNKFVHDAYTEGADVFYPVYTPRVPDKPWPIKANDMAQGNTTNLLIQSVMNDYQVATGGLKAGDIIIFPNEEGPGHMGIYIGSGQMIQAGGSGVVKTQIRDRDGYEDMVVRRYIP